MLVFFLRHSVVIIVMCLLCLWITFEERLKCTLLLQYKLQTKISKVPWSSRMWRCSRTMATQREWVSSVLRPHQHSIGYTGDATQLSTTLCQWNQMAETLHVKLVSAVHNMQHKFSLISPNCWKSKDTFITSVYLRIGFFWFLWH